jgi:hypothetical protein
MLVKRENRYKLRWIGAVLLVAFLVNLYQPAAYALTTVGQVITGLASSNYGEQVQFTSVVTDRALGGATPAGSVTFYDGGTLIGGPQGLVTSDPVVVYKNYGLAPAQPGKKFTCTDCPVIEWGGLSYWAYSDTDNSDTAYLYAYDANNNLVKSWDFSGNRYITDITVDNIAKTVTLVGQSNVTTQTWEQLENFNAHASMSFSGLGVGTHTITANYSGGDGIHSPQSSTFVHTVNKLQTNTTLTSNAGLIYVGEPITFTATVVNTSGSPVMPGGTVTFREGSNVLGTAIANGSGVATFTTSSLPVSGYSVTATYDGDGQHEASTSSSLSQSVLGIPTIVAVSASPASTTYGNSVTLTATVTNGRASIFGPTGTVTFKEGSTVLGTGTLSSGTATWTASNLEVGVHSITAHYSGSLTHDANSSSSIPVGVNLIPTSSTLTVIGATGAASTYGTSLTLTASVVNTNGSSITPSGTVTFKEGSTTLGTATLNSGTAEWLLPDLLSTGAHSFQTEYGGDASHAMNSSAVVGHTVNKASTSTTLATSGGNSVGETTTLTAQVTNTSNPSIKPTGTVTFKNNGADLQAPVALDSSGIAVLTTHELPVGNLIITAAYSGDSNHVTSASQPITQPVSKAPVTVHLSVAPQGESVYGHRVSVTVQVDNAGSGGSVPTGTVTLSGTGGFSNWPGALTLMDGIATWETEQLAVGTHTVIASYLGDDEHLDAVSTSSSLQIKPIPVTVVVTASVTEAVYYGSSLTFTAHVTNANGEPQIPAGQIVFSGGNLLDTPIHLDSAGTASITSAALLPGTHSIQAVYVPDLLHEAQTSAPITQVIKPNTQGTVLILNHPSGTFQLGEPIHFSVSIGGLIGDLTQPGYISLRENGLEQARVTTDVYGNAEISLTSVSSGTHRYTALYERSGITDGTESQAVTVIVRPALAQLMLTGDVYAKMLPTSSPWIAAVVHGGVSSVFTLHAVSSEAGTRVELKQMDPQSGELGAAIEVANGQSEPISLVEGLNRFQLKVVSSDGTASTEHIVSLFYQIGEKLWDISHVLTVTPLRYDMDGNHVLDKADIIELLKLIEPVTVETLRP